MRIRRALLLTPLAAILSAMVGVTASASPIVPGSDYVWAQPGTAAVTTPYAQPPAWIPVAPSWTSMYPVTDYVWAQPGTAAVTTPHSQPPASIPISDET